MCGSPAGQDGPEAICDAHGEIQLYGCVEISCAGSSLPPFLVGIDLTLYDSGGDLERSLPAVYTDPPLTNISACMDSHPLVSWDGPSWEPLTVRCGLSSHVLMVVLYVTTLACIFHCCISCSKASATAHDREVIGENHALVPAFLSVAFENNARSRLF